MEGITGARDLTRAGKREGRTPRRRQLLATASPAERAGCSKTAHGTGNGYAASNRHNGPDCHACAYRSACGTCGGSTSRGSASRTTGRSASRTTGRSASRATSRSASRGTSGNNASGGASGGRKRASPLRNASYLNGLRNAGHNQNPGQCQCPLREHSGRRDSRDSIHATRT